MADHIANRNLCPGADTVDEWLGKTWVEVRVGQRSIPVFPLWGIKRALIAHDVHHVLTGYATTLKGEFELAAWELRVAAAVGTRSSGQIGSPASRSA